MKNRSPNLNLFGDDLPGTAPQFKAVAVVAGGAQRQLSKAQKAFNTLIKQIEARRCELAVWEAAIPPYQEKYTKELIPLVDGSVDLQVKMVHHLDQASSLKGLSKTERRMIVDLITELAGQLAAARNDAEMKAIYNKYSYSDYDDDMAEDLEGMKAMLEDILDVELGDDFDMSSPEDILSRAQQHMREQQTQYDAEMQAREERRSKRKKSAKQLAKEAQQQAAELKISQSLREVYRKLASALHPDREHDPQERARKTSLMQRANQAYEKNNLLQLLELQLELEHIDQAAINNIDEDRLKHYNLILKEQLGELAQEIYDVQDRFRAQFNIDPFVNLAPATLMRHLDRDIVGVKQAIRDLQNDLRAFGDIKQLKAWLKDMRRQPRVDDYDDVPF